jgi:hypothetical protein
MKRITFTVILLTLVAGAGIAQQQSAPDAHENPAIQESPDGKKNPPVPQRETIPQLLKQEKPVPERSPKEPVRPPAPTLNTDEAILGTWDLVRDKSDFNPGPAPEAEVRTYLRTPAGITVTVTTTDAGGSVRSVSYPWQADGKEHPMIGSKLLDSILLEKKDNLTAEATMKHGDKVIASERRELAPDGKTMTIKVKDLTSTERPIIATAVYRKR